MVAEWDIRTQDTPPDTSHKQRWQAAVCQAAERGEIDPREWGAIHQCRMTPRKGGQWYSHQVAGKWCNGRSQHIEMPYTFWFLWPPYIRLHTLSSSSPP
jgi:hypothetical protein